MHWIIETTSGFAVLMVTCWGFYWIGRFDQKRQEGRGVASAFHDARLRYIDSMFSAGMQVGEVFKRLTPSVHEIYEIRDKYQKMKIEW